MSKISEFNSQLMYFLHIWKVEKSVEQVIPTTFEFWFDDQVNNSVKNITKYLSLCLFPKQV